VKIGMDIRRATEFGAGTYTRNIVRELCKIDRSNDYFLIGAPRTAAEVGDLPSNFKVFPLFESDSTIKGHLEFRHLVKRLGCHIVHIPQLFWMPRNLSCPYVITVHDVVEHMYLARDGSNLRRSLHFQLTRHVLKSAARILAVSNFTKSEIEKLFGIPGGYIQVVYNAIDERFLRGHASESDRQALIERYQVTYPFLLYAGRISPHKNVVRIIQAFAVLKNELQRQALFPDLKLIIIGDELSKHPDLRRTVIRSGVQNDVRFMGFVPIEMLRVFYDAAEVFVFPSLYEGFGLQPLEAMAHGTTVVTSNTSSLPEAIGEAAVMVNPENVFEIMRALHRVLVDPALRKEMRCRGYDQVKKYSWGASAQQILEVYKEVGSEGRNRMQGHYAA
jgi:glycosyltransferase involved in cell wall biosynthesis